MVLPDVRFSGLRATFGTSTGCLTRWKSDSLTVNSAAELSQFGLGEPLDEQRYEVADAAAVESGVQFMNQTGYSLR